MYFVSVKKNYTIDSEHMMCFKEIINIRFFFLFIYALTFWLREGHLGCQTASPQEGEVDGGSHQG